MNGAKIKLAALMTMLTCLTSHAATAQTIESLVMPGQLVRGHADIESECSSCHKPFNRTGQRALCLDCHEEVANDVGVGIGFHGRSPEARSDECASCHADHDGRNADILGLDELAFDHLLTEFELLGKHSDATCADCHDADAKHRDATTECVGCHLEDDAHQNRLGSECANCHNPSDWLDAKFDHSTTSFALLGKHDAVGCLDCHADQTWQDTATTCFGCHAEDDSHQGRNGEQCDTCHNPSSWADASFDHSLNTDFVLDGRHARLTCGDCHSEDPFGDSLDTGCVACHIEDDDHDGHYGSDCAQCHTSDGWAGSQFDHNRDTDFRLNGGHRTTACVDCHVDPIFDVALETGCISCHLDDDVHEQQLGKQCGDCHNEIEWKAAPFFDHDLTAFPLLGEHGNIECDDCHQTLLFKDTEAGCASCHLEDDPHDRVFANDCESCHNPVAWDLWLFDHDLRTDFSLSGAHLSLACGECHRSSLSSMQRGSQQCADCHRPDDVHDGEFGPDCGRCHSDTSFTEVRALQ